LSQNAAARLETLAQIAELYFVQGLSQEQIAIKTNYSRSMISRLLTEARESGVVEIRIHHPLGRAVHLESALQSAFGINTVRVLERSGMSDAQARHRLAALAARTLEEHVRDGITLGISWGRTLAETINALRTQPRSGMHVVQLLGSLGSRLPEIDGSELARRLARTYSGQYHTLAAPLIVANERVRDALMQDRVMQEVFEYAHRCDIALLGIGTADPRYSALVHAGFISVAEAEALLDQGATGDICATHLNLLGKPVATPFGKRIIGIDLDTLKGIPLRIGVAGGYEKSSAVAAALRSGLINLLVTDELAAVGALAHAASDRQNSTS
jgi:DNA-binding transcriptional regulator LsrR (DeoR family)